MNASAPSTRNAHIVITVKLDENRTYGDVVSDLLTELGSSTHCDPSSEHVTVDVVESESLGQRFRTDRGTMTMPDHADVVRSADGRRLFLLLDGVPFPYAIDRDSLAAEPTVGRGPDSVSINLIVGRVTITDEPKADPS